MVTTLLRAHAAHGERLHPVDQLAGGGLLLDAGHVAQPVEGLHGHLQQPFAQAGLVHQHDLPHHLRARELDVVEHAAAQERVGQLLLRVGGDDHDGPVDGADGLAGLRDVENSI